MGIPLYAAIIASYVHKVWWCKGSCFSGWPFCHRMLRALPTLWWWTSRWIDISSKQLINNVPSHANCLLTACYWHHQHWHLPRNHCIHLPGWYRWLEQPMEVMWRYHSFIVFIHQPQTLDLINVWKKAATQLNLRSTQDKVHQFLQLPISTNLDFMCRLQCLIINFSFTQQGKNTTQKITATYRWIWWWLCVVKTHHTSGINKWMQHDSVKETTQLSGR
jgi:hypothetical protein